MTSKRPKLCVRDSLRKATLYFKFIDSYVERQACFDDCGLGQLWWRVSQSCPPRLLAAADQRNIAALRPTRRLSPLMAAMP